MGLFKLANKIFHDIAVLQLWMVISGASFSVMDLLNLIPAWKSNYMPNKVWYGITYLFPNFNTAPLLKYGNE